MAYAYRKRRTGRFRRNLYRRYTRPTRRYGFRATRRYARSSTRRSISSRKRSKLLKRYRKRGKLFPQTVIENTRGILRWMQGYMLYFQTIWNAKPNQQINWKEIPRPTNDGLYTAIKILTRLAWHCARYIYKYQKRFRVFPKLYENNKPNPEQKDQTRKEISNLPAGVAVAKEFYTVIRLMRKPNPQSTDWNAIMKAHQSMASIAILVTASALGSAKLELFMEALFDDTNIHLGEIVLGQLDAIKKMVNEYNIIPAAGIVNKFP